VQFEIQQWRAEQMHDPEETSFTQGQIDPDAVLWVRGVDYLAGWRQAQDAAADLTEALEIAGLPHAATTVRADTTADGSALVRLACTPMEVRTLVRLMSTQAR
jgi:hypothetical protein